jgi:peptide/nickel transport system substrate-binding protein
MHRCCLGAVACLIVATLATMLATPGHAENFRFASDGDASSLDPYSRNETFQLSFLQNIYDPLVRRDQNLHLEPALATSWEQPTPLTWRFHLRQGVTFQGGEPFTADDVVFSYQRATGATSNIQSFFTSVKAIHEVDDHTVDFELKQPDLAFVQGITGWVMMSHIWAAAHGAMQSADLTTKVENFASRHTDGTGPYVLDSREPDRRTTLTANPAWWDHRTGNVTTAQFDVIGNPATRLAALLSGETDMLYAVPPQDVARLQHTAGMQVIEGPELRTLYLGLDQSRDELLKSDVKGRNPFKDRRVRLAVYEAIDIAAIHDRVMLGQSHPTGLPYGPGINGYTAASDVRYPYDPGHAKQLLAEAGYPNGFGVTLDCTNDRYVNDGAICQAITNMLARVGIKITLNAESKNIYFAEVSPPKYATSLFMLGYTPASYDALNPLSYLFGTRAPARGEFNIGGYSNPAFDDLLGKIAVSTSDTERTADIVAAAKILHDDVAVIPLHQQVIVWAARDKITLTQLADDTFPLRFVTVK